LTNLCRPYSRWQNSFVACHLSHWWQEDDERKIAAMTGFLLFLLIVAAVVAGLESRHRRTIHEGYGAWTSDPELLRDRRELHTRYCA